MEFIGQNDGDEKVSSTNKATKEQVFGFSILSDNSLQGIGDSEIIHLPQQVELNDEQIHLNQKNGEEIILLMNASQGDAHGDPRTSHDSEGNTEITTVGNLPVTVNTGAVKMEYGKENGGIYDMLPSELDVLKDGNTDTLSVDVSHVLHSASKQKGLARKVQDDDSGPVHDMSEEAKWKTVTEGFVCSETLKKGKGEHYNNVSDFQGLENAVIENNKCLPKGFHKEESSWKENIPKPGVPMGKRSQLCVTCVNICESDLDQVETEVECKQKDSAKSSDRLHWPVIAKLEREDSSLKQILPTEKLENISYQVLNILDKETVDVQVENCNQGRVVTQVSGPNYVKVSNHKEEYDQAQNFGMGGAQVLTGRDNFNQNTVVAQACASTYSIHTGEDDQQHLLPQIFDSMNNQVSVPKEECDQDGIIGPASDPSNILASTPEDKSDQDIMGTEIISLNGIQLSSYKKECHKEDIVVSASKPNDIQDSTTEKECHKEDIIQVYCSEKQLGEQNSLVQFQNSCTKFDQSSLKTNILSIPELGDMKKAFELQDDDCCFSVKHEPQAAEEMLKTLMENNRDSSIQVAVPYELETNVQKSCREGINDSIGDLSHTYKEFFTKENVLKSYSKKASFESHIIIPKIKGKSEQLVTMCKTPESIDQVEWSDSSETLTDNKSQTAKKRKIQAGSGTCGKQLKIVEATLSDSIKENKEMETMVEMTPRTSRKRNTSNIVGLRTLYLRSSVKKIKKYSESHSSHVKSIPKLYTDQSDKDEMEADQSNISQMKTNLRLEADKQKDTDVQGITDHIVKNKNKSKRNQPSCRESENTCEERRKQTPRLSVHKSNRFTNEIQINKNFSELLEKQWAELTGRRLSHSKTRKKTKKSEFTTPKEDDRQIKVSEEKCEENRVSEAGGNKQEQNLAAPLEKEYDIRLRYQYSPPHKTTMYSCFECGFSTSRLCNLVYHYKASCPAFFQKDLWKEAVQEKLQTRFSTERVVPEKCPSRHVIIASTEKTSSKNNTKRKLFSQDKSERKTNVNLEKYHQEYEKQQEEDKMNSYTEDDTDDDDLPPAFDTPIKNAFGFDKDDIVWVYFKKLYWPAVVRRIYFKLKKVSVRFIGLAQVNSGIRVSIKKINTFDNAERNKKYLSLPHKPEDAVAIVNAVQRAEDFLRKRCLGYKVDAWQFFETRDEDFPEYLSGVGNTSRGIGSESRMESKTPEPVLSPVQCPSFSTTLEKEFGCRETEGSPDNQTNLRTKRKESLKLVNCIKSGQVETHLLGVYSGTIPSDRHTKFHSVVASVRNQIKQVSWFGPIDEEEQQEKVCEYCIQLFKTSCEPGTSLDVVAYVFEVWVPEAIIKALSQEQGVSLEEAEKIFNHCAF